MGASSSRSRRISRLTALTLKFSVMLSKRSAAFHLAEAVIEQRHYLALAEQNLNNNKYPRRGE